MATIKGVWTFNSTVWFPPSDIGTVVVNFTVSNYPQLPSYAIVKISWVNSAAYWALTTAGGGSQKSYISDLGGKSWDFGEAAQDVPNAFRTWMETYATQQISDEPTIITYNGVTNNLDAGKTATLACKGKKMKSDISIVFGSAGNITYNGTQTDVEAEKTATLHCRDKIMKSDVVITV